MNEEMQILYSQGTWNLVHALQGTPVVGCHWIHSVKFNPNGSIQRFKARLVTKGSFIYLVLITLTHSLRGSLPFAYYSLLLSIWHSIYSS